MSSSYIYRVLKSSWGVRIEVAAHAEVLRGIPACKVASQELLSIQFSGAAAGISAALKREVEQGLSVVADDIVEACDGNAVAVTVYELNFNETDFQPEGVPVAMIRWAEHEFGLPERQIEESYDRASNRYVFRY